MDKRERMTRISANAAKQSLENCAAKIQQLTNRQCDALMEELKKNAVDKAEVNKLQQKIQIATDKNRTLIEFMNSSRTLCQAITSIINKIL